MGSSNDGTICVMLLVLTICLPMAAVMVNDWRITKTYDSAFCSGESLTGYRSSSSGLAAHGTVKTCVTVSESNATCTNKTVELYYPAANYYLAGKRTREVDSWVASLGAAKTFRCYIKDLKKPDLEMTKGISDHYDRIWGWFILIVVSGIFWVLLLCLCCFAGIDSLKSCCRKSSPPPRTSHAALINAPSSPEIAVPPIYTAGIYTAGETNPNTVVDLPPSYDAVAAAEADKNESHV